MCEKCSTQLQRLNATLSWILDLPHLYRIYRIELTALFLTRPIHILLPAFRFCLDSQQVQSGSLEYFGSLANRRNRLGLALGFNSRY